MAEILLSLTFILLGTKLAAHLCNKINIPSVIGELLVGIVIGPGVLGLVHPNEVMDIFSQIGVIFLMFLAGLESDFNLLKKYLKPSFSVAILGVIFPAVVFLILGLCYHFPFNEALFLGIVFAATSVSISVQVLREYNKVNSKEGAVILGAAVVDDIIVVIMVSMFTTFLKHQGHLAINSEFIWDILVKKIIFFVITFLFAKYLLQPILELSKKLIAQEAVTAIALACCFAFSFLSEELGMSDVIGAFFMGLMLSLTHHREIIQEKIEAIGYALFIPIFFVSIGLKVHFRGITDNLIIALLLIILGVLTKLIGGYIASRFNGLNKMQSLVVGSGMVSRGEMALIIVQMGTQFHLINQNMYSTIVLAIIITTLISPFLIKMAINE